MVSKRTYKALTSKQTAKVKKYTKAGKSQQVIAKLLGVSKQRVATSQKKSKVGKRVASTFWSDVKQHKEMFTISHRKATREVKFSPKWRKKYERRTGKRRPAYNEFLKMVREEFDNITPNEWKKRKKAGKEGIEFEYDGTVYSYLGEK